MKTNTIRSDSRGYFDHGWLKTYHTFSFADYYNPERMSFGALRVLNDDQVMPGNGFGMHSHSNMEIISIPLSGVLEHEDNTGIKGTIRKHEIQVMSAGTGIFHSERNAGDEIVSFLQIWILPSERSIKPRYEQRKFDPDSAIDTNQLLVSADGRNKSLKIYQDAYISQRFAKSNEAFDFYPVSNSNGLFIFIIEGGILVNNEKINKRDSISVFPGESFITITPDIGSHLLFIEVPMI